MSHPPNESPEFCTVDDCSRPVRAKGLCRAHYAREERGVAVDGPLRQWGDPRRSLMEAAFAFADASSASDEEYERAWKRLYRAAKRLSGNKVEKGGQSHAHEQR